MQRYGELSCVALLFHPSGLAESSPGDRVGLRARRAPLMPQQGLFGRSGDERAGKLESDEIGQAISVMCRLIAMASIFA